jgi:hypothetical protein
MPSSILSFKNCSKNIPNTYSASKQLFETLLGVHTMPLGGHAFFKEMF